MHKQLAWDDLLYVLAVGRSGSLSGAARLLGVNHSTVFRRIALTEDRLGVRLFDRQRKGYSPTPAGEAMISFAEEMDIGITALERRLVGEDMRPAGTVRLASTDTLLPLLAGLMPGFASQYPNIRLELATATQMVNLTRRDADVALRATTAPDEHLVGRKLASIGFAIYGAKEYVCHAGGDDLSENHSWIGLDETLAHTAAYKWLASNAPFENTRLVVSSLSGAMAAARHGNGLALLPCYMVDKDQDLVRCSPVLPAVSSELWLLVHRDLRKVARVRALLDYLGHEIGKLAAFFSGASTRNG